MAKGSIAQGGWLSVQTNRIQEKPFTVAAQAGPIRRAFRRSVPPKRPQKPLLSRKCIWVLVLALCGSFALKYLGAVTGGDSTQGTRLIAATSKSRKEDEVDTEEKGKPTDDRVYSTTVEDDISSQLHSIDVIGTSAESGGEDESSGEAEATYEAETSGDAHPQDRLCARDTVLRTAVPLFARPVHQLPDPTTEEGKWVNNSGELGEFLQKTAGPDVAKEFQALVTKKLQPEESLTLSTKVLLTTVLEIQKQRLVRAATDCFNSRRQREEAYATMLIMQQYLIALKNHVEKDQQLPAHLAKVVEAFDGKWNMAQEETALADAKSAYEVALREEWRNLDKLYYQTVKLTGHVAVMEIAGRVDASTGDWKAKMPKLQDMGAAMNDVGSLMSSDMLALSHLPAVAAAVVKAKNSTFAANDAAYKGFAKLAAIIAMRQRINKNFRLAQDPEAENLTTPMAHNARVKAYRLMDEVERLQKETSSYLESRKGTAPEMEPWLALIL